MVQLAAVWIIGVLASNDSSTYMPEPVRIAYCSFLDIKNPETYKAPDESLQLQAGCKTSVDPNFRFTEWWKIADGEKSNKPFDIGEELVERLLHVLDMVSLIKYLCSLINQGHRG